MEILGKIQAIYATQGVYAVLSRAFAKVLWSVKGPFASLYDIGRRHGTDKTNPFPICDRLSYLHVYEQYFAPLRRMRLNILEIGVLNGSSLRMWKTYFPNARLFGLDIDPRCKAFEEKRVSITVGSQADQRVLEEVVQKAGHFDIIIDDGSHVNRHILTSFHYLFPRLRPGGFYVLEDLEESYAKLDDGGVRSLWPGMHYNDPADDLNNVRADLDSFFANILDDIDHARGDILSMHFWPYSCVIMKHPGR